VSKLPDDWWVSAPGLECLVKTFERHMLGLVILVPGSKPDCPKREVFTGMLLDYHGLTFWLTAGHVIRELDKIRRAYAREQTTAVWYDRCDRREASGIPTELTSMKWCALQSHGVDVGVAHLDSYYVELIRANEDRVFLTPQVWQGPEESKPDGYALVGFPAEHVSLRSMVPQGQGFTVNVDCALACVPVRQIERKVADRSTNFWRDEHAFYGELVDMGDKQMPLGSVVGMSGGPIFSVSSEATDLRYHLVAIQSAWLPSPRLIRAARIADADTVMQAGLRWAMRELGLD